MVSSKMLPRLTVMHRALVLFGYSTLARCCLMGSSMVTVDWVDSLKVINTLVSETLWLESLPWVLVLVQRLYYELYSRILHPICLIVRYQIYKTTRKMTNNNTQNWLLHIILTCTLCFHTFFPPILDLKVEGMGQWGYRGCYQQSLRHCPC